MYNAFECHFKPNQKSQSDMTDPVKDTPDFFLFVGKKRYTCDPQDTHGDTCPP